MDGYFEKGLMHGENRRDDFRNMDMNDAKEVVAFFQFALHVRSKGVEEQLPEVLRDEERH